MRECVVVDDDEVTRELAVLFVTQAGFEAVAAADGTEAVELLSGRAAPGAVPPDAVLLDLQMPGLSGAELLRQIRAACGPATRLVAMSARRPDLEERREYDGFLLKPFSPQQLEAALEGRTALSEATFSTLSDSMPRAQLMELYLLCLDDADRRIGHMRDALLQGDAEAYRRLAHAIRGGCGMVGALELAQLAAAMEDDGPDPGGSAAPLDDFLVASSRLRRILSTHAS